MASKVPYDAFLAKLQEVLEPTIPVVEWESLVQNMEQREASFVAVEDNLSQDDPVSIGSPSANCMRESGEFTLHLFIPAHEGFGPGRILADQLRSQLRFQVLTDSILLQTVSPPAAGLIADGLWSSMLLNVEYQYNYVAPTYVA